MQIIRIKNLKKHALQKLIYAARLHWIAPRLHWKVLSSENLFYINNLSPTILQENDVGFLLRINCKFFIYRNVWWLFDHISSQVVTFSPYKAILTLRLFNLKINFTKRLNQHTKEFKFCEFNMLLEYKTKWKTAPSRSCTTKLTF